LSADQQEAGVQLGIDIGKELTKNTIDAERIEVEKARIAQQAMQQRPQPPKENK